MPADAQSHPMGRLDDDDYPAFTMGRAAELIGASPASCAPSAKPA